MSTVAQMEISSALPEGCRYAQGRFAFDCEDPDGGGLLRLAAWQVGRVWLNGGPLGRLYVGCHDDEWRYMEFDLAGKLHRGRNVIGVLLHAWGLPEETIPGVPPPQPICLAAAGAADGTDFADAARWRFAPAAAFLPAPRHNSLIGHEEWHDLRRESADWLLSEFDDSSWKSARAADELRQKFLPAPHRHLREERHVPARIVEQGRLVEAWAGIATPPSPDCLWWRIRAMAASFGRTFFHDQRVGSRFFVNNVESTAAISPSMDWVFLFLPYFLEKGRAYELRGQLAAAAPPMHVGWDRLASPADTILEWASTPEGPWTTGTIHPDIPHRLMIDRIEPQAISNLDTDGTLDWSVTDEESVMVLEFPRSMTMLPRLEFADASAGIEVELVYSEHLSAIPGLRFPAVYRDRAILRDGAQTWEVALQYKSTRCLAVIIRARGGFARLHRVSAVYRHYDYDETGSFQSDDERLNQVWAICRNTLEAGSQDFIMDGPWREQLLYIGDNLVHNRAAYHLYANVELVEWQHRLYADGQMPDGLFQPNQPCRTSPEHYRLLDQTILWPIQLEDHWQHTGNREFISNLLPNVLRLLDGFQHLFGRATEGDPRLRNLTGWNWVDHPGSLDNGTMRSIRHNGIPTAINLFYVMALDSAVRLLRECGDPADATAATRLAELAVHLRQALRNSHWKASRRVFADCVVDGTPSPEISLHVNLLAILAELADEPRALLERTWKQPDVLQPVGVFFHIHLLEVLYRLGMQDELVNEIRGEWGAFLEVGLTTTPENALLNGVCWDSVGHPWGASPIIYLIKSVAGLRPLEPGWRTVEVSPHLGSLRKLRVSVPTPRGEIHADFQRTETGVHGIVHAPANVRVVMSETLGNRIEVQQQRD